MDSQGSGRLFGTTSAELAGLGRTCVTIGALLLPPGPWLLPARFSTLKKITNSLLGTGGDFKKKKKKTRFTSYGWETSIVPRGERDK